MEYHFRSESNSVNYSNYPYAKPTILTSLGGLIEENPLEKDSSYTSNTQVRCEAKLYGLFGGKQLYCGHCGPLLTVTMSIFN